MISESKLRETIKEKYGFEVFQTERLDGYDSANFLVQTETKPFILKLYEEATIADLEAETLVMERAAGDSLSGFPVPIPDLTGAKVWENDSGIKGRLLSFVKGEFFGDLDANDQLHDSYGGFLAGVDTRLLGLRLDAVSARKLDWDIRNFELNQKLVGNITDKHDRAIVEYFFLQFRERFRYFESRLRKSVIHGDAHDQNVLTDGKAVTGIIDFGDVCYTYLVNELAVALSYRMFDEEDPVLAIEPMLKGYHQILALEEIELEALYFLIAVRLCISVCHSSGANPAQPNYQYVKGCEDEAWKLLRQLLTINPVWAENEFRRMAGMPSKLEDRTEQDRDKRNKSTSHALSLTFEKPIKMKSAAFQYMYDSLGNSYLDCYNNIPQVGHCHPRVVEAGQRAMAALNTNTRYLSDGYNSYAENLLEKFPSHLEKVFFVNSGSAASDLAIRLAMSFSGNEDLMVMEHGYHGNTRLGIDISHYKYNRKGGAGRPERIIEAPLPDMYKRSGDSVNAIAGEAIKRIEDRSLAAFIAEPVVGCGGQVPLPIGYLEKIYPAVHNAGGVCISDEVQTGFGRLGKNFWGFEMLGVLPDIVVMGKPMGNGHPIAAVVTTNKIAESFETGMEFFSSFGGNTVSCAIGQAVLDVLDEEELPSNAEIVGGYLLEKLEGLVDRFEKVGDARGAGLFLGLELVESKESKKPNTELAAIVREDLRKCGILVGTDGPDINVIKLKPPICFSKANADQLTLEIEKTLKEYE